MIQLKVFHVYRAVRCRLQESHIEKVVTAIKEWYDGGCQDMTLQVVRLGYGKVIIDNYNNGFYIDY